MGLHSLADLDDRANILEIVAMCTSIAPQFAERCTHFAPDDKKDKGFHRWKPLFVGGPART